MKKLFSKQILFLLLLLAMVFSCQKDDNIENTIDLQANKNVLA